MCAAEVFFAAGRVLFTAAYGALPLKGVKQGSRKSQRSEIFGEEERQALRARRQAQRAVRHGALPRRVGGASDAYAELPFPFGSLGKASRPMAARTREQPALRAAGSSPCIISTGAQKRHDQRHAFSRAGGTESRKNAHSIISDKQNGILLPSRFAAFGLSAIRQTISRKPGLMPCRWLAPCKRLSLRLYRSTLTAILTFL